jgi:hypothetical protein
MVLNLLLSIASKARVSVFEHILRFQPSTTSVCNFVVDFSTTNFAVTFTDVLSDWYLVCGQISHPGTKIHNLLQDWRAARCNPKLRALPS